MPHKISSTLRFSQAQVIGLASLAASAGVYAVILGSVESRKLAITLLVLPAVVGLVSLRHAPRMLIVSLVISLCFSARFRVLGQAFHPGGAELTVAPLDFPLLALVALWLPRFLRSWRFPLLPDRTLRWGYGIFLLSHFISIVPAPDRDLALLELFRLLKMALLVFIMAYYLNSRRKLVSVLEVLFLMMIIQGLLAVAQSAFHLSFGLDFLGEHDLKLASKQTITIARAGGTLGHPNVLANFFEVLTPVAFALIPSGVEGRLRRLTYAALLFGLVGTFLTFSRAGWLSLAVGLFVVSLHYRRRLSRGRVLSALVLVGLVLMGIGLAFRGVILARLTVFWETSVLVRVVTARTALSMLRSNPLFGVGLNNYLEVSSAYVDVEYAPTSKLLKAAAAVVHNVALLYGAEQGAFGLFAFGVLLLSVTWVAGRIIRQGDPLMAPLAVGILAGMLALVVHGMWDWLFRYDPVYTLFWFNVGLLTAMSRILRHSLPVQAMRLYLVERGYVRASG